jgi:hypothetical protein
MMYLFTRAGRLAPGPPGPALAHVASVTEKVHDETGLEISAWLSSMSPELGTCVWSCMVDSLEELEAANDKLAVSDQFARLLTDGAEILTGEARDGLAQFVHGEPAADGPRPSYVTVVRATAVNGRLRDAMAGGVEIATAATELTGVPTSFLVETTGAYGGCRWVSAFADIGSVQRSEAALNADGTWMELIDRVGTLYTQGASQSMYRRIA